jgi:predicted hydrocarbon binding protein
MFGNNAVFNHLFNSLIEASVESSEEELSRWQKFNMLTISQKTMTPEAIQQLTRPSLGDYVHIGVLQSIVTSILAINPASKEYLYNVGLNMGKYSNTQFRFLTANPRILEHTDSFSKFRDLLEGLQELYSANSFGLPLFLSSRSLIVANDKFKAQIQVYDSAYSARMAPIGQPVCYLIAGEIAGLIETTIGEENVSVVETKCWGLGDNLCQFDIEIGKKKDFSHERTRAFLTEEEKTKFQNSLNIISRNMYKSSLLRTVLRPNPGDYVHISVLQQALNGIKFSDPFFSSLLYYAGIHYGKYGADFEIMERVMKKSNLTPPLEFEEACMVLLGYLNDPSTILTRLYGQSFIEVEDDDLIKIKINESAISAGLNFEVDGQSLFDVDRQKAVLCDFTAGFIQGRLSKVLPENEEISVKEIGCHSLGMDYCEFQIEID